MASEEAGLPPASTSGASGSQRPGPPRTVLFSAPHCLTTGPADERVAQVIGLSGIRLPLLCWFPALGLGQVTSLSLSFLVCQVKLVIALSPQGCLGLSRGIPYALCEALGAGVPINRIMGSLSCLLAFSLSSSCLLIHTSLSGRVSRLWEQWEHCKLRH